MIYVQLKDNAENEMDNFLNHEPKAVQLSNEGKTSLDLWKLWTNIDDDISWFNLDFLCYKKKGKSTKN